MSALDRDVLRITLVLWAAYFGIMATRSAVTGINNGLVEISVRVGVSIAGVVSSIGLYWILSGLNIASKKRFYWAVLLSVPACLMLAVINELAWLVATPFYEVNYGLRPDDMLSGRCSLRPHGCSPFYAGYVATAAALFWIYVAWSALYNGAIVASQLRHRDRQLGVAEMATQQAELMTLRFQLNPHFLFNTLNTVSGLIVLNRNEQAENVVVSLSNFLRYSLASERDPVVTLASELVAQHMYLDIEKIRFTERLRLSFDVPSECEAACLPAFILQPLLENTMKHAVAPSEQPVTVTIAAEREAGDLVVRVENSPSTARPRNENICGFGIGLTNVRKRLETLYGESASFTAAATPAGGWVNILRLPWMEDCNDHKNSRR